MKIIILGLGNFGSHLGKSLMQDEHEVIGVDMSMDKVQKYLGELTATMSLDTTVDAAIQELPLADTDIVVIAIGEDVGASITTTALIKKNFGGRIIARTINEVHKHVLEAMNITDIVEPEAEFADELANRIMLSGAIKTMDLPGDYEIAEVETPCKLVGVNIRALDAKNKHEVYIVTTVKKQEKRNIFGNISYEMIVNGILHHDYNIQKDDYLLIFGTNKKIKQFIESFS